MKRTPVSLFIPVGDGAGCNETVCELRLANYSRHDPSVIECVADNHKSTRISKVFHVDVHCEYSANATSPQLGDLPVRLQTLRN